VFSKSAWEKMVKKHYSEKSQTKRINETVKFITDYCLKHKQNGKATFRGLWKYLDVLDEKHVNKFLGDLRTSLEVTLFEYENIVILTDDVEDGEELFITWN
jgi:hypothetical protein